MNHYKYVLGYYLDKLTAYLKNILPQLHTSLRKSVKLVLQVRL